jgi:hypothetical protein
MTMVEERGRDGVVTAPAWLAGQLLVMLAGLPPSPGCWMLTNSDLPSGVEKMPVTSHSRGPTRKRFSVAPGALPIRVACVPVLAPIVLVIVLVVPSPTLPGMAASSMQLVTSV